MAKKASEGIVGGEPVVAAEVRSDRTLEDIQKEIAEVELETKKLQLAEARKRNADFTQREESRRKANQQRMSELEAGRRGAEAIIADCRHKSGGNPKNVLKGGGIGSFSILTRAIMPDGVTEFIQCQRCRLKVYFRLLTPGEERKLKAGDPEKWAIYAANKKLHDTSIDQGLEHAEIKGPTFFFKNENGVPIIPEMR